MYKGEELFFTEEKTSGFCFADSHTLIAGNLEQVKAWIDRRDADGNLSVNSNLISQIEAMKYNKGLWLNVIPSVWQEMLHSKDLKKFNALKSLEKVWISMDITDQVLFSAKGGFSDEENAKLFTDAFKGVIAAGKLSVSDERDVIDILNKIDVKAKGKEISIEFKLTQEDASKLLEKKKKLRRKMMPV